MTRSRMERFLAAMACVGLVLPSSSLAAPPVKAAVSKIAARPRIDDIELAAGQTLHGVVLDETGGPAVAVPVELQQLGRGIASGVTDDTGHFAIPGVAGGVYQVNAGRSMMVYRLWAHQTAPPTALTSVTLAEPVTVRGQKPFRSIFTSNAFILTAVVVAAVAIPIAIHDARNERGSGS